MGRQVRLGAGALLLGATGIGFAPILVRLSECGPVATAFYRILFALPVLWIWMRVERAAGALPNTSSISLKRLAWLLLLSGLAFAGDLGFWHWSIRLTTIANSTLLTNLAPVFVLIGARIWFQEPMTKPLLLGMALAIAGGTLLVGASVELSSDYVLGDMLALVAAAFYAAYLLTVKQLRRSIPTGTLLFWSGLVSCPAFGLAAFLSGEIFLPQTGRGWMYLVALALVSHVCGQGLITYALAHLPAGFSAVSLLMQPVVAACLAWLILAERLSPLQMAGGVTVLCGIGLAARLRVSGSSP